MYKRGDIVLIPFPFTDLSGTKIRPAVVVSTTAYEKENGNITVDPKLVRYNPGILTNADLSEVDKRLRVALGL